MPREIRTEIETNLETNKESSNEYKEFSEQEISDAEETQAELNSLSREIDEADAAILDVTEIETKEAFHSEMNETAAQYTEVINETTEEITGLVEEQETTLSDNISILEQATGIRETASGILESAAEELENSKLEYQQYGETAESLKQEHQESVDDSLSRLEDAFNS